MTASSAPFPPRDLSGFLAFCAGEWMSLRSRFALTAAGNDEWHSSERGDLLVEWLEGEAKGDLGGLAVTPKGHGRRQLRFQADGHFQAGSGDAEGAAEAEMRGRWQLWPDGSLELVVELDDRERRERIWFTKPNLRLRSTVEQYRDGRPGEASFSSEIRRVSRPPAQEA